MMKEKKEEEEEPTKVEAVRFALGFSIQSLFRLGIYCCSQLYCCGWSPNPARADWTRKSAASHRLRAGGVDFEANNEPYDWSEALLTRLAPNVTQSIVLNDRRELEDMCAGEALIAAQRRHAPDH